MDSRIEEEGEAGMGETLTKAMHINDVAPCVEISRFDAQLFHTKTHLALLWNLSALHSAAAAQRPGSRQVPLLKAPPGPQSPPALQPPPPTLPLFSLFFSCEF